MEQPPLSTDPEVITGIEVPEAMRHELERNEEQAASSSTLKSPIRNSKWLSDLEEKAALLFLAKVLHFSTTTGSTTTAQIGKSWPHANIQRGLVDQIKRWQEKRQLKFRSDLFFYWATNLEEEEKLVIHRTNGKSTSRFSIQPTKNVVLDELPEDSVFEVRAEDEQSDEDESSFEEEKEKNSEKKLRSSKAEGPPSSHTRPNKRVRKQSEVVERPTKRAKTKEEKDIPKVDFFETSTPGLVAASSYRNRFHTDKDRFRQLSTDMVNNVKECDLIMRELWQQNSEAETTIMELMKQVKDLTTRREGDARLICQLREENAILQAQIKKSRVKTGDPVVKSRESSSDEGKNDSLANNVVEATR